MCARALIGYSVEPMGDKYGFPFQINAANLQALGFLPSCGVFLVRNWGVVIWLSCFELFVDPIFVSILSS